MCVYIFIKIGIYIYIYACSLARGGGGLRPLVLCSCECSVWLAVLSVWPSMCICGVHAYLCVGAYWEYKLSLATGWG